MLRAPATIVAPKKKDSGISIEIYKKNHRQLNTAIRYHSTTTRHNHLDLLKKLLLDDTDHPIDINYQDRSTAPYVYPSLEMAIDYYNIPALKMLLKRSGVDITIKDDVGRPPYITAVRSGNVEAVQIFLAGGVDPNTYVYGNALLYALECVSSFALINTEEAEWFYSGTNDIINWCQAADEALKKELTDFFHQSGKYKVEKNSKGMPFETLGSTLCVRYYGSLSVIETLLAAEVRYWTLDCDNITPEEIVQYPAKQVSCIHNFKGVVSNEVAITDNQITFDCQLLNKCDSAPAITVKVLYDFSRLQEKFKIHIAKYSHKVVAPQIESVMRGIRQELDEEVERKVEYESDRIDTVEKIVNLALQIKINRIENLPQSLIFYNRVSKYLEKMVKIYFDASTDFFTRNQQTDLEEASSIREFIGSNTPSPFKVAFVVLGEVLEEAGYALETRHFGKIAAVLPLEGGITEFAQNVAVSTIDYFSEYFANNGISFDKFTEEEMLELAKRTFIVVVYTLYKVEDLGIANPLSIPSETRVEVIKAKMLEAVASSDYIARELSSMERAANQRNIVERRTEVTMAFSSSALVVMTTQLPTNRTKMNGKKAIKDTSHSDHSEKSRPDSKPQRTCCIVM